MPKECCYFCHEMHEKPNGFGINAGFQNERCEILHTQPGYFSQKFNYLADRINGN